MRVGIFIPIYFRDALVKNCLESLIKSDFGGIDVFLCLGINGATKEFKKYLKEYVNRVSRKPFSSVHVFDGDQNFGKPKIINLMAEKYNNFDYLVSIDSDMVTTDDKWLKKFLYSFDLCNTDRQLGALCSNQIGNNCHFVQNENNHIEHKIADGLTLVYHPKNIGVAGGVLMINKSTWDYIEGYKAHKLYGSDDGYVAYYLVLSNKIFGLIKEINFFHPPDDEENGGKEYKEWKSNICREKETPKIYPTGFFEKLREK